MQIPIVYLCTIFLKSCFERVTVLYCSLLTGLVFFQAGINDEGKGVVYRYDPVGFMEELTQGSGGAAVALVQPFLDNQVERNNRNDKVEGNI